MTSHHFSHSRTARSARVACLAAALALSGLASGGAWAQEGPSTAERLAAQRQAMQALDRIDGIWRGPAWTLRPDGSKHEITQTERIGPFLGGSLKLIEGRGYEADGRVSFNAFAVVSHDLQRGTFQIQSHAQGYAGSFAFLPTADGYTWSVPAGPDAVLRYTAVIKGEDFVEVGDRESPGKPPQRVFEMRLKRVGGTTWPEAGSVPAR